MNKFARLGMSADDWRKLAKMLSDATVYNGRLDVTSLQNSMECEAARLEREDAAVEAAEE